MSLSRKQSISGRQHIFWLSSYKSIKDWGLTLLPSGKSRGDKKYTVINPLPTGIDERCSQIIPLTLLVATFYRRVLPLWAECWTNSLSSYQCTLISSTLTQGLLGACAGEKISLIVPPELAYGDKVHPVSCHRLSLTILYRNVYNFFAFKIISSLVLFLLNCLSLPHLHYISLKCLSSLSLHICIFHYLSNFLKETLFILSKVTT